MGQAQQSEDRGRHSLQGVSGEPVPFTTRLAAAGAVMDAGKEEQGAGAGSGASARQTPRPEQDPEAPGTGGSKSSEKAQSKSSSRKSHVEEATQGQR